MEKKKRTHVKLKLKQKIMFQNMTMIHYR